MKFYDSPLFFCPLLGEQSRGPRPSDFHFEPGGVYVAGSKALRRKAQVAEKVEVQEALPPAGVLGRSPCAMRRNAFSVKPRSDIRGHTRSYRFFEVSAQRQAL